jgi:hypothetical protein
MATGQEVLAHYQITVDQAIEFIRANLEQPEVIFNAAFESGITTQHLSDITGFSTDSISDFFASFGLDTKALDEVKILFNSDIGDFANFVGFNVRGEVLSNTSLGNQVKLQVDPVEYSAFNESVFDYQEVDGIYTSDELGITHLANVPATVESIESLVYGTLINIYSALDETELSQLKSFSHTESNVNEYRSILTEVLSDPANRSDQDLANVVVNETAALIDEYWNGDVQVTGNLDLSLLGLAGIA